MPPGRRRGGGGWILRSKLPHEAHGAIDSYIHTMPTSRNRNRGTHAYRAASTDSNVSTVSHVENILYIAIGTYIPTITMQSHTATKRETTSDEDTGNGNLNLNMQVQYRSRSLHDIMYLRGNIIYTRPDCSQVLITSIDNRRVAQREDVIHHIPLADRTIA